MTDNLRPGWTYLEGQRHPWYLMNANNNVDEAHKAHNNLVDIDACKDLIDHAWKYAVKCERLARDAYIRWQQEQCPHTVTRAEHIGEYWMVQGEPYDNDTEGPTVCIKCHKHIG